VVVNIVSNHDLGDKKYLINKLQKISIYITLALFLLVILFSKNLLANLHYSSVWPFIILAAVLAVSALIAFRMAVLQGEKDFKRVSILNFIQAVLRLVLGAALVTIGWATLGAMGGLLLAQLIALYYAYIKTRDKLPSLTLEDLKPNFGNNHKIENEELMAELKYGLFIFIILFSVTALYTFDVVLVKKYFSPTDAGLYSGLATVARILFFSTSSVSGVLLASVKISAPQEEKIKTLKRSLYFLLAISLPILALFTLFPNQILTVLIGGRYSHFSQLLPLLSASVFLTSILNLFFYYSIALRKFKVSIVGLIALVSIFGLSYFWHQSLQQLIYNFLIANIVSIIALAIISRLKAD
jgi:O-antigen/teichoic acid export membrane protein